MKKSALKISLLISLSTLFAACGSHSNTSTTKPTNVPIDQATYSAEWSGALCYSGICRNNTEKPNKISIEDTNRESSNDYKLSTISLVAGENKNPANKKEYKLTLLQQDSIGIAYYGYRTYGYENNTKKGVEVLYGINKNYLSQPPKDFKAQYLGKNSFIYSKFSEDDSSYQIKYADITLNYNNGDLTGTVTQTNNQQEVLFNINKDKENDVVITPTQASTIPTEKKAILDIKFVSSTKNTKNYQYLVGTALGDDWVSVFSAEKQNGTKTASQ